MFWRDDKGFQIQGKAAKIFEPAWYKVFLEGDASYKIYLISEKTDDFSYKD